MTCSTFFVNSGLTYRVLFTTWDTVAMDTPAIFAISFIVIFKVYLPNPFCFSRFSALVIYGYDQDQKTNFLNAINRYD